MQSDQQFYPQKVVPPLAYQVGGSCMFNGSVVSALNVSLPPGPKLLAPFHGVEVQSSEVCPKNFIIFDQTDNKSRIMFHPELSHKFSYPGFDIHATSIQDNGGIKAIEKVNGGTSSPLKEDTHDIDALLGLEEEEQEDGDEVSTARTLGSSSSDSCSTYGSKASKRTLSSSQQSSGSGSSSNSERKRQRMKRMMKALRGIVPGGDQMNTVAVLDEAVIYLKSLKLEVKKLGIGNFEN